MNINRYWRRIHWILPICKKILRTGGHTNNFSGTDRQNLRNQTPGMARWHNNVPKRSIGKHELEVKETRTKLNEAKYRLRPKKCEFFKKQAEWVGHKKDQDRIRRKTK